jgi:hypothetical protein
MTGSPCTVDTILDDIESKSSASDHYDQSLESSSTSKIAPTATKDTIDGENSDDSSFDIAPDESKMVYRSKLLVLSVIFIAAAAFGATTYFFIHNDEVDKFQSDVSFFPHLVFCRCASQ